MKKINTANDFFKIGNKKITNIDYKGAKEDYTAAIKLDQNQSEYYFWRGYTNSRLDNYKSAQKDYTAAIKLDQSQSEYYFWRGRSKSKLQNFKGAEEDYTAAIKLDQSQSEYYFWRGHSKSKLRNFKGAEEDYTAAIKLDQSQSGYYFYKGLSLYYLKKYKEAIVDYTKSIKLINRINSLNSNRAILDLVLGIAKDKIKKDSGKNNYKKFVKNSFNIKRNIEDPNIRLLKFRPININTLNLLNKNETWFAHPNTLNDPLDCKNLQTYFRKYNSPNLIKLFDNIFVLSFSKIYLNQKKTNLKTNNLMWSHYTKNHEGVCLVYKLKKVKINKFFEDKITYGDFDLKETDMLHRFDIINKGFFTKNGNWKYEQEFRLICYDDNNYTILQKGKSVSLETIGLELDEIIFGLNCKLDNKTLIINLIKVQEKYKNIRFYEIKKLKYNLVKKKLIKKNLYF